MSYSPTVDGKTVTLGYAYAARERNFFDESKDAVLVVLTDKPLKMGTTELRYAVGDATTAISFMFREDATAFKHVSGHWMVGQSEMKHEGVARGKSLVSPDRDVQVDVVALTREHVEGTPAVCSREVAAVAQ